MRLCHQIRVFVCKDRLNLVRAHHPEHGFHPSNSWLVAFLRFEGFRGHNFEQIAIHEPAGRCYTANWQTEALRGDHARLTDPRAFADWLKPMRQCEWVVYAKRPFAGPDVVLAYLSRYTHRVAIANSRLIALDEQAVTFKWKDYRAKERYRHKTMTLAADEFILRFLLHVLPSRFHRIRHYGLLANTTRKDNLARARELLMSKATDDLTDAETQGADTVDVRGHDLPDLRVPGRTPF